MQTNAPAVMDRPVTEYVRRVLIHEWLTTPDEQGRARTQIELSERAGLAPSYVGQVYRGIFGISNKALRGLAKALGTTPSKILSDAEKWWRATGKDLFDVEHEPKYPNLESAVENARVFGVSEDAIEIVRRRMRPLVDLSEFAWHDALERHERHVQARSPDKVAPIRKKSSSSP